MKKTGKVFLVSAGPGDPGLLTCRGAELIRRAEAAVYDRLVSREVLELLPEHAEKIPVGKFAGRHPVPQEKIHEILIAKAREGKQVVRIQGGDCFLFGRGGEEGLALRQAGIPFEMVPGVTSALSAPASAGIPVTHRGLSSSVHILTGHGQKNSPVAIDYESLARTGGTLVFLMSVATIGEITEGLLRAGMAPDTPAAAVENGTMGSRRKFLVPLSELERTAAENKVQSPAVFIVGKVCGLSESLDWFAERPLFGRKILVTAPENSAGRLSALLREQGAEVLYMPCIRLEELDTAVREPLSRA